MTYYNNLIKILNPEASIKRAIFWLLLMVAMGLVSNGGYIYLKAQLAQYLIADAWEKTLLGNKKVRPWSWADTWPVARLKIENNNNEVELYVLNGANGASLPFGPGLMTGTAFPGEPGSSVIAGHRDTHFSFLKDIVQGEKIQIENRNGEIFWYQVDAMFVADSRTQTLQTTQIAEQLILVTCYPFDAIDPGGPFRYVVTAKRINV